MEAPHHHTGWRPVPYSRFGVVPSRHILGDVSWAVTIVASLRWSRLLSCRLPAGAKRTDASAAVLPGRQQLSSRARSVRYGGTSPSHWLEASTQTHSFGVVPSRHILGDASGTVTIVASLRWSRLLSYRLPAGTHRGCIATGFQLGLVWLEASTLTHSFGVVPSRHTLGGCFVDRNHRRFAPMVTVTQLPASSRNTSVAALLPASSRNKADCRINTGFQPEHIGRRIATGFQPERHKKKASLVCEALERKTRLELATPTLARSCSTN